jgi:predicted alpha/beta-hydrolase family hydrolase
VRGVLHRPTGPPGAGLVLAHGAGSSAAAPLLVALAEALAEAGTTVLRCDLPFRQARPKGPPRPADAPRDREGLRAAVLALRGTVPGPVALGGHSYGGRQASLLASEAPDLVPALLLLAYPLHPPGSPRQRTAHFPCLRTRVLFVHGTRDPFGGETELRAAMTAIPAPVDLLVVEGAGHDLAASPTARATLAARVAARWRERPGTGVR